MMTEPTNANYVASTDRDTLAEELVNAVAWWTSPNVKNEYRKAIKAVLMHYERAAKEGQNAIHN